MGFAIVAIFNAALGAIPANNTARKLLGIVTNHASFRAGFCFCGRGRLLGRTGHLRLSGKTKSSVNHRPADLIVALLKIGIERLTTRFVRYAEPDGIHLKLNAGDSASAGATET
jgi:hypothetical protein